MTYAEHKLQWNECTSVDVFQPLIGHFPKHLCDVIQKEKHAGSLFFARQ